MYIEYLSKWAFDYLVDREPCDREYLESPIDPCAKSPLPVVPISPRPSNVTFDTPRTEDSDPDRQSLSEIHVENVRRQVSSDSPLRERIQRSHLNAVSPDLMVKVPHPTVGFQKGKTCLLNHGGHFVQISQTTADRFTLPRENTNFTSRTVDFNLDGQNIVLKTGTAGPDMKDVYGSRNPYDGSGKRESERAKLIRTLLRSDRSGHGSKSSGTSQTSNNFMVSFNGCMLQLAYREYGV